MKRGIQNQEWRNVSAVRDVRQTLGLPISGAMKSVLEPRLYQNYNVSQLISECQKEYSRKLTSIQKENQYLNQQIIELKRQLISKRAEMGSLNSTLAKRTEQLNELKNKSLSQHNRVREDCWKKYMERIDSFLKNVNSNGLKAVGEKVRQLQHSNYLLQQQNGSLAQQNALAIQQVQQQKALHSRFVKQLQLKHESEIASLRKCKGITKSQIQELMGISKKPRKDYVKFFVDHGQGLNAQSRCKFLLQKLEKADIILNQFLLLLRDQQLLLKTHQKRNEEELKKLKLGLRNQIKSRVEQKNKTRTQSQVHTRRDMKF